MYGALIGDINGSKYEFDNIKSKDFKLFDSGMFFTDDSVLTIMVEKTFLECAPILKTEEWENNFKKQLINNFCDAVKKYPNSGFGGMFYKWALGHDNYAPYNSFGNGSAMRISPVGWIADSQDEVIRLSKLVSEITHNHIEGIKGAEATAMCIFLARNGASKEFIKTYVINKYYPEIANFNYKDLIRDYNFDPTCQNTVPEAIYCFLISKDFKDCIKTSISIGGDSDTLACIACSIAEAYYGQNDYIVDKIPVIKKFLPRTLGEIVTDFNFHFIDKPSIEQINFIEQFSKQELNYVKILEDFGKSIIVYFPAELKNNNQFISSNIDEIKELVLCSDGRGNNYYPFCISRPLANIAAKQFVQTSLKNYAGYLLKLGNKNDLIFFETDKTRIALHYSFVFGKEF